MMSRWPLWIGSKEPGYRTLVIAVTLPPGGLVLTNRVGSEGPSLSDHHVGGAVALAAQHLPPEGRLDLTVRLEHGEVGRQLVEEVEPGVVVVLVRRVEEGEVPSLVAGRA